MTQSARVRCLDDELGEYVAGTLGAEREWAWDRHLVACRLCAHAVAEERRIRAALAGAPSMPGDLRSSLLALGRTLATEAVPTAPVGAPDPLRLLRPDAPACHRSPLRATVVAAAAAGVSAAAAWSLTVAGTTPARTGLTTSTVPAVTPTRTTVATPPGSAALVPVRWSPGRAPTVGSSGQAESTP